LRSQSGVKVSGKTDPSDVFDFVVRTPKLFHFDLNAGNQIMEYLPNSINLKEYIIKHASSPTSDSAKAQWSELGKAVGKWLKVFHNNIKDNSDVLEAVSKTDFTQQVKHMINFTWLFERAKTHPAILEEAKEVFEQVEKSAATESRNQICHGDFWTGKYVAHSRLGLQVHILIRIT
jgi:hypothetical protein